MTDELDFHAASPDELVAAHRNVFDVWSKGRSLDDHVQHRLRSPTHRRAAWFVGCLDGRVVCSLAAHPVQFHIQGEPHPGIAIGSVHTLQEMRGRGFAPKLIAWVEAHQLRQGVGLSVLYSDINPDYYARLGYTLCPSWEGFRSVEDELPAPAHRLVPFAIGDRLEMVKRTYAQYHGAMPLSIERNDAYWEMMLEKFAGDMFHGLEASDGSWAGYVLVGPRDGTWRIVDYALVDGSEALAEQMYAALAAAARAAGIRRFGGWLPKSPATQALFTLVPRKTEITMIKPLAWRGDLSTEMIAGAGQFCELDHV